MQESTLILALAGLLHDVGKFALRAGQKGATRIWDPDAERDYGHFHALLTDDFISVYVPSTWQTTTKNAAGMHHRPDRREAKIIAAADRLSAGERADPAANDRAAQPRQLLSIFCDVESDEQRTAEKRFWPLEALALRDDVVFPRQALDEQGAWQAYERLWREFTREAALLRDAHTPEGDLLSYLEGMQLLLLRYTWAMPSAYYKTRPDISLYDHGRMTGALAALLEGGAQDGHLAQLVSRPESFQETVALLVGGDLSGVQDFIYTVTARGATGALRGRSFYLQLLTEAAARYVLRRLELPITNLIYGGGGNFYLLARAGDVSRLPEIQAEISRILLAQHRGDLYLALAAQPLSGEDFFDGRISAAWREVGEGLQRAKARRFAELGEELAALFEPQGNGGNEDRQCQVCGEEHPGTEAVDKSEDNPEGLRKCPPCQGYEALGDDLRRARYLVLDEVTPTQTGPGEAGVRGEWRETLAAMGMAAELAQSVERLRGGLKSPVIRRTVLALDDEAAPALAPAQRTAVGRRLVVNVTPTVTWREIEDLHSQGVRGLPWRESIKPFDILKHDSEGIERLGVLRMDADGMGELFSKGLRNDATLSRVASLSFAVSLFFEGWVGVLAERHNRSAEGGKDRIYSIYSGGDDLFFVGSWDAVAELAREIRRDLTLFAAGHPGIHASAGIALVGGKYPLYQAAHDAGQAEDEAKALRWHDGQGHSRTKDAVCFLGQALPWERFGLQECDEPGIGTAHALMHLLMGMTEGGVEARAAPKALIRRLGGLYRQYADAEKKRRERGEDLNKGGKPQVLWGPWMWRAAYQLKRMEKQNRNIEGLREQLSADRFRSIEYMGLAARWAELRTRKAK